ncbi:MAG TPA: hypothetical protein VJL88_03215 [Nitrospira sp.]|nr:hypothetical protein [Nitrospira sp.]
MEPSEFAQGVEYTMLMSHNDKVCKQVLGLFNRDLGEFGTEKYDEHEEFRSIGWKKENIVRMEGEREVSDFVEAARIDINNDGTKDIVFRWKGSVRGYERDYLYIFPSLQPSEKQWTLMEIAHSPGRITHGDYLLIQPSAAAKRKRRDQIPRMASISRLELFVFDGTTYVGMRPLYEFATGTDSLTEELKVYVVTKYREGKYGGGPDPKEKETGKREDVCYFKIQTLPG